MLPRAFFLLYIAGACCPAWGQTDSADLERINAAIAKAEQALAAMRTERSQVAAEIEASEKNILINLQQLDAISAALSAQQSELAELQSLQQQLSADSAAQQALIASYARGAWMNGKDAYLKLLLNQEDPARSSRLLRYYAYFNTARAEKLATFRQTLAELTRVSSDIETGTVALEEQQRVLESERDALALNQDERANLLARLDADLAARGAELEQLEMEKIEIEILLQELQSSLPEVAIVAEQEPFINRKGQLNWPLDGPHINSFGSRHSLGDLTWEGITIGATAGADVRAIHHGRVVFADWFTSSGLLLIIDHGDGYMSLYAHNQELYKAVGEWVAAGDVIAAAGNTGGQREPSLYFEIRRNGRAENPLNWCTPR